VIGKIKSQRLKKRCGFTGGDHVVQQGFVEVLGRSGNPRKKDENYTNNFETEQGEKKEAKGVCGKKPNHCPRKKDRRKEPIKGGEGQGGGGDMGTKARGKTRVKGQNGKLRTVGKKS